MPLQFTPFPILETERLVLRRMVMADAQNIFNMRSNDEIMRYIQKPRPKVLADVEEIIAKMDTGIETNTAVSWGMCLKGQNELIGTIGFWRIVSEHFRAEIGYMLKPEFQGQGIMQEAIATCLQYAFGTMGLHSIEANVHPENMASKKLLERNGFVLEGYFKESFYYQGAFLDSAIFSLVNR